MVLHTFGADTKWNTHIHVICTTGGITGDNESYKDLYSKYIPYQQLKETWRYNLINNLRIFLNKHKPDLYQGYLTLFNSLFSFSRYVRCEPKVTMIWKITNYLGRYLYRPPIAESRITNYNQEDCTISITYQHKQPKETRHATIDVLEFIGNLFRHIPDKYFHMVQYGGIFSNRCKSYYLDILSSITIIPRQGHSKMPTCFRQRMIKSFGIDPILCTTCNILMQYSGISFGSKLDDP